MDTILSFMLSILAGVITYYISNTGAFFLPNGIIAYAENEINILLWMIISINLDRKSFHRQYSNLQTAFKKQF